MTPRELEVLQRIVAGKSNKEIAEELNLSANTVVGASREHHGCAWDSQDGRASRLRNPKWSGESALRRRDFFMDGCAAGIGAAISQAQLFAQTRNDPRFSS